MTREVEIKFAVAPDELPGLVEWLAKNCEYISVESHKDTYYDPPHRSFLTERLPFKWLSIREREDLALLNYKHFHPEGAEEHSYADEYETVVHDAEALQRILTEGLGARAVATVRKRRTIYKYLSGDSLEVEIALDDVEQLGTYVEFEAKGAHEREVDRVRMALSSLAAEAGLSHTDRDNRGYPFRLLELTRQPHQGKR